MSNLPHQTIEKLQKNHGVLRGPQLGKQSWRPRLDILRVKQNALEFSFIFDNPNPLFIATYRFKTEAALTMHCNDNNCVERYNKVRFIFREIKGTVSNNEEGNHECVYGEPEVTSRSSEC